MNEQKSLALGASLTPKTFANFIERLRHDHVGEGVNSHHTADAIFIVQARRIAFGIDREYTDNWAVCCEGLVWFNPVDYWNDCGEDVRAKLNEKTLDEHQCEFLDITWEQSQWELLSDMEETSVTGFDESWEYVTAHFTQDAAEAFIERKKHDYRYGLRVIVEAQAHCWEWNAIKEALIDGRISWKHQFDEEAYFR